MGRLLERCGLLLLAVFFCSFLLDQPANAAVAVKICIIGGTNPCVGPGPSPLTIPAGWPGDNITTFTNGQVVGDDSAERLAFIGKIKFITASMPVNDYEIEITGTGFTPPPNLETATNWYRLTALNQTFKRNSGAGAQGNIVKANGFVQPTNPGGWNWIGDVSLVKYIYLNSFYFFNGSYLQEQVPGNAGTTRDLKINLKLTAIIKDDVADFTGAGLELRHITNPAEDIPPSDCNAPECSTNLEKEHCDDWSQKCVIIIVILIVIIFVLWWRPWLRR